MRTDEISKLLKHLAEGEAGLRRFFAGLGFDRRNSPLPPIEGEGMTGWLQAQPCQIAVDDHSGLSVLWLPVRNLSDDAQKKVCRYYRARFPVALYIFWSKEKTWAWELRTQRLKASCRFHLDQTDSSLFEVVRALYVADDASLDIDRLDQALRAVGVANVPTTTPSKPSWKPQTDAEVRELARRIKRGGDDGLLARNLLVEANLRLVIANAKLYLYCGLDMEDLIQEGILGLIRAAEKFDWQRGTRFSTYATHWIRQRLRRAAENKALPIRIPSYLVEVVTRVQRETQRLHDLLERDPDLEELSAATNLPLKSIRSGLSTLRLQPQALDQPIPGTTLWLCDVVPAPAHFQPEQLATAAALREEINRALEHLTSREKTVLSLRYGLSEDAEGPMTLEQVGQALGVSRERARQIEAGALGKLLHRDVFAPLRATILGQDEERVEKQGVSTPVAPAVKPPSTHASKGPDGTSPEEDRECYIRQKRLRNLRLKQQEYQQLSEAGLPQVELATESAEPCIPQLTLLLEEELLVQSSPPPQEPTKKLSEEVCKNCGSSVEVKRMLTGRYYSCRNCKHKGML